MEKILEQNDFSRPPKVGEVIKGKIVQKGKSSLFLDLGNFKMGILYGREFFQTKDFLKNLKIGDELSAKITELENEDGYVELSIQEAHEDMAWEELREKKEKGESFAVKIIGVNKGGLLSKVSNLPAFLPLSQVSPQHYSGSESREIGQIVRELQKLIGKELMVKIFNLDYRNRTVVISEKLGQFDTVGALLKNYNVGDIIEGEITGLTEFGAFIKFGKEGLDGLIHSSEIDSSEILKSNQKIKAKIINISNNKVYLSLKGKKED